MAIVSFTRPFGAAECDICGERDCRVENPPGYAVENAAKQAGWWFRKNSISDEFCVCPECRQRMRIKE